MRRLFALAALPALAVSVAACGPDAPAVETSPSPVAEATSDQETPEDPTTSSTADASEQSSSVPSDGGGDSAPTANARTVVETVFVDDSWAIESIEEDLCANGSMVPSPYARKVETTFTCGPTAASALACEYIDDDTVECITNPTEKMAITFESPGGPDRMVELRTMERESDPIPLTVTLRDGAVCATVSHDQEQHYGEMFSWYRCDDGSELLTDEDIANTFEEDDGLWTAQRSLDKGAPQTVEIASVQFAGR